MPILRQQRRDMRPKHKDNRLFTLTRESLEAICQLPSGSIDLRNLKKYLETLKCDEAQEFKKRIKTKYESLKIVTQPSLTAEQTRRLPLQFQNAHKLVGKLQKTCDANSVSVEELSDAIKNCLEQLPTVAVGEEGYALWSYGASLNEFYLKWVMHVGVSQLLSAWLTAAATQNSLLRVASLEVGQIVAVESDLDENWYRAKVLEIRPTNVVRCLYIDYGNTEFNYIDRIREIPKELSWIPPFAFCAKLYDLNISADKVEGIYVLNLLEALKTAEFFECKIKECSEVSGISKVRVRRTDLVAFTESMRDIKCATISEDDVFPYYEDHPLNEEIPLMKYGNQEIQLYPRPATDTSALLTFAITHFVDPSEFYVRIRSESEQEAFEDLQISMMHFYESNSANQLKIKTTRVLKDRLYAWRNPETGFWERVIVERTDTAYGTAVTRRIDYGNVIIVKVDEMMEMQPVFCHVHSMVQPAHMVHIKPSGNRNYWMAEDVAEIKRLISLDASFQGLVLSKSAEAYDSSYEWKSLGVILIFGGEPAPFTMQAMLVERGVGVGTGIGAGSPFLIPNIATYVLEMEMFRISSAPSKDLVPLKNGHNLFWGSALPAAPEENHGNIATVVGDIDELPKMGKLKIIEQDLLRQRIPSLMRQRMAWIEFSHIVGPGNFYVQMKHTLPFLAVIMKNVAEKAHDKIVEEHEIQRGEFFAALFRHEGLNKIVFTESWNRVFVLKYDSNSKHAQVLLVDFGIVASIHKDGLRKLPSFFLEIPHFCQRCHLSSASLIPATGKKWTLSSNRVFKEYLQDYSIEFPVYFAYQAAHTDRVKLHHYDQEMIYTGDKWEPENSVTNPKTEWMAEYRRHPLLRNFFYSLGISVDYEIGYSGPNKYDFQPVWDALQVHGYAMSRKTEVVGKPTVVPVNN